MSSYQKSGVNVIVGDQFVENIQSKLKKQFSSLAPAAHQRVCQGVGGFAAVYDMQDDRYLVAGTDGVGTKLKLAQELNIHDTIGIDLVAMCVNDILCTGARTLFFLDYLAMGKLELSVSEKIIDGILAGLKIAQAPLIGGETAEMPGMYLNGEYDLAGFAVGEVKKPDLISGDRIKAGDVLIGIPSSGFHSNGYSLLRQLIQDESYEVKKDFLTPTRIYTQEVKAMQEMFGPGLKGLAHITGSGLANIPRINPKFNYMLLAEKWMESWTPGIELIFKKLDKNIVDTFGTFNMGIGMVAALDRESYKQNSQKIPFKFHEIGQVENGAGMAVLKYDNKNFEF